MPKNKKVSSSDSEAEDTSSLSSGAEEEVVKEPKAKKSKPSKSKSEKKETEKKEASGNGKSKGVKNSDGETKFDLGGKKFLTVRKFKGKKYVDIREFYEANGEMRPGKKGISLNEELWDAVKELITEVDDCLDTI